MKPQRRVPSRTKKLGSVLSITISLVVHLVVTLLLSWIVIGYSGTGLHGIRLNGMQLSEDSETEQPLVEIAASTERKLAEEPLPRESEIAVPNVQAETSLAWSATSHATAPNLSSSALEETALALMMGGEGDEADAAGGGDAGGKPTGSGATFYGTRATGNRFVFVIDSSTSMVGPRWQSLRYELNRALRSLSPDQEFFVISFDFLAHPMFNEPPPQGQFLNPTKENIERLNRWLNSIQHGSNTLPATAIGIALRLEPDAIFLLSDGEIRDATVSDLRLYNRTLNAKGSLAARIPIHTVLLQSEIGFVTLKTIADENDGVFTPVR